MKNLSSKPEIPSTVLMHNAARKPYRQIDIEYNSELKILTTYLKPEGAQCFNIGLLEELRYNALEIEKNNGQFFLNNSYVPVDYHVVASRDTDVFNFGGDLALFIDLIKSDNREGLMRYAKLCIDCIYARLINYRSSAITISLVQGEALGGGFETALTSNIIIAEESARMGLPEILFNLFPGMGGYSMLCRRGGSQLAEKMISSGKIYQADELYEMGIVDLLVADGDGHQAIHDLARQQKKRLNGLRSMYACRQHNQPITYDELMRIVEIWVDATLQLTEKDLQMMSLLMRSQIRKRGATAQKKIQPEMMDMNIELVAA